LKYENADWALYKKARGQLRKAYIRRKFGMEVYIRAIQQIQEAYNKTREKEK